MKKFTKVLAVVLALAVVAVSFAACSGTKETAKVININLTDEVYALGVNKDDAELLQQANDFISKIKADGSFDKICNNYFGDGEPVAVTSASEDTSKDQLVVATNAEFEPFEYKKGDQFYGIDMEVVKAFADSIGKELVIKDMNFDAVVTSVQSGKADVAAAGLTVNESRAAQVNFTESYYSASQQVIVKSSDTKFDECKTKEDVEAVLNALDETVKIGGQSGTTGQSYVQGDLDNQDGFGFAGLKAQFKGYSNGSLAVQDMLNGGVDYVIIDAAPAAAITTAINAVA